MIQFLDLRTQYGQLATQMEEAVIATLRGGTYVLGEPVELFEEEFARYCGSRHAIAVSSGTAALHLALLAAGIGPGDEVITVSATFVATVAAILYTGATPVLVDIDPVTWTMDPAQVAAAITPKTRAILPVHLHGRLADMQAICGIADAHGLIVIEDAAQAHGAKRGKTAGSFGAMGCFSFYPGKNLGAYGEGGAVVTDDDALAGRLRCLRDWGQNGKYNHVVLGYNYRMDAIQGAVLGVKLPHLDGWNDRRRAVANAYDQGLAPEVPRAAGPFGADHVCHVYAIGTQHREAFRAHLASVGVPTNVHYPCPVHLQPGFANLGHGRGAFPVTEMLADRTLSLPIHPHLSDAETELVIRAVNHFAVPETAPLPLAPEQETKMDLKPKRILVTGGSGFVGSHIVDALLAEGCRSVTVVDNMVRGRPANLAAAMDTGRVRLVTGDIRDAALMRQLVAESDVVFHQAALRITHCAAEPDEAMSVMVNATHDLLQLCVAHDVEKVVMASSASIYGLARQFPTPESEPPYADRTLYGAAKSFGEGLLRSFHDMYGLNYVALRYFNVYGPRMDLHGRYTEVMVRWMERLAAGQPPIVFGDGLQTMDMIDVRDVARANVLAAKSAQTDAVFNVGSGSETSLLGLASALAAGMGRSDLLPVHAAERAVNPVPRRLADTGAARRLIGFESRIPLDEGLRELIGWWQSEQALALGAAE